MEIFSITHFFYSLETGFQTTFHHLLHVYRPIFTISHKFVLLTCVLIYCFNLIACLLSIAQIGFKWWNTYWSNREKIRYVSFSYGLSTRYPVVRLWLVCLIQSGWIPGWWLSLVSKRVIFRSLGKYNYFIYTRYTMDSKLTGVLM